ncbi:protein fam8a1 [Plakobranchus ocellatus]|uniref:Protein fam8a1 n=1 Tax=Plakobranchus ocellatus TaxID=259542 RepID=A0AAV3Y465_9GAST|nr:protein fam8a1 [Plakobranchus ocellatus]
MSSSDTYDNGLNGQNNRVSEDPRNRSRTATDQRTQTPTYQNAREYAQALRPWLWQYHSSYAMHSFAMNCAMQMQAMSHFAYTNSLNNNYCSAVPSTYLRSRNDPYANRRPHNQPNGQVQNENAQQARQGAGDQPADGQAGVVLKIPTFWKRVAAELIDFTFLFYIKMTVSFFLMTEFSLDQLSFLASDDIFDSFSELDYDRAFAITFEVIALEIINRVLITFFETMCICRTVGNGVAIGATPGKRLMNLRVVSCESVQTVGDGQVRVVPAGNVSFKNAFLRSVIKNFTIAFFLPACLTLFFFKHNRTAYDVVSHTIVVEDRA